ncbi:hypothetical protein O159_11140 [Leifsonia xyli subsp. cynodontis DSM 46306]|jgi:hypothetical protein|uniref:DUF3093 domain-containing protein n=1 Tax=Leifsonia xyli subsp. cynodontis DSM 46306 TaxID=1389489 RepID=U3P6X4_LEIXC|nr:DUF3093 domain-containing protein [Leifsonia xyli]AGW41209.1 hypothetical protein O159_11140 [Leifsonia xyli subsp. cynodontis DSM 46306]
MDLYRERLWATPWLFVSTLLVVPAVMLVFAPIDLTIGVVLALAFYAAIVAALLLSAPTIRVTETELVAGRARLPLEFAGAPEAFAGEQATLERGRRLDARAWLLIRGWIKPVVKVPLLDADDPTPYWLLSTRNPDRLVQVLEEARQEP